VGGKSPDCYLCGSSIGRGDSAIDIPQLGLRVHSTCYERDLGADGETPPAERAAP
jgi:hypothetical protein